MVTSFMDKRRKVTKKVLRAALLDLPLVARSEGWIFTLDSDDGTFFYSPRVIPTQAELYQVTDEFAIYLDRDLKPRGVMIEYYDHNFIEHHPEIKKLSEELFKETDDETIIINPSASRTSKQVKKFQEVLQSTILHEALHDGHGMEGK